MHRGARLIYVNVSAVEQSTLCHRSHRVRGLRLKFTLMSSPTISGGNTMRQLRHFVKPATAAGLAVSAMLGFAGVTFSSAPASAVIYCTYVGYPAGCIARAGVVLRPRPVARAAVRQNVGSNANGGINRVGAGR
jgi:hypothetical protein